MKNFFILLCLTLLFILGTIIYFSTRTSVQLKESNNAEGSEAITSSRDLSWFDSELFSFAYPSIWQARKEGDGGGGWMITFRGQDNMLVLMEGEKYFRSASILDEDQLNQRIDTLKQIFEQKKFNAIPGNQYYAFLFDMATSKKENIEYLSSQEDKVRGILLTTTEGFDVDSLQQHVRYVGYHKEKGAFLDIDYVLSEEENAEDIRSLITFMVCSLENKQHSCNLPDIAIPYHFTLTEEEASAKAQQLFDGQAKVVSIYAGEHSRGNDVYLITIHHQEKLYEVFVDKETGEIVEKAFRANLEGTP